MKRSPFAASISVQTVFPGPNVIPSLSDVLISLRENGFYGIELNIPDLYKTITPDKLRKELDTYELKMDYLATGAFAKKNRLSLSTSDQKLRELSIEGLLQNITYASEFECGIILGFFKGGISKDRISAASYLEQSIYHALPLAEKLNVTILLEVTNHTECSVLNTLEEGAVLIDKIGSPFVKLLADTYHMNIDEPDLFSSLEKYVNYFPHLHLSDNTRTYPGFGTLDFARIARTLHRIGYKGSYALEGNLQSGLINDINTSADYLHTLY